MPDTLLDRYRRNGFVFPIPVLPPEAASATAHLVDDLAATCSIQPVRLPYTHGYFRWAFDLATHPTLLDLVERIVGPDILIWGTLILSKQPDRRSFVCWHQDCAYTPHLDGTPALTAWLALTPATCENGCMRLIPGVHGERLPFHTEKQAGDMVIRGISLKDEVDESRAVDVALQPGEASLHEISVVHGSGPNLSSGSRTGFIIRYSTPAMRQPEYPVHCARGNPGAIRCDTPPGADTPASLTAYLEYLRAEALLPAGSK